MQKAKLIIVAAAVASAAVLTPAAADVIAEDKGLYEDEVRSVQPYYNDLDDPSDRAGIITEGDDPADPSGPAVDFELAPGSLGLNYDNEEEEYER